MFRRLNLGCGSRRLDGFCNVDRFAGCEPDVLHDLEQFPWPFPDDCAEEILLSHVLEHLGADPAVFLRVMQELYRISRHGAQIEVRVPHPLHRDFRTDPTHVRCVTPETLAMFSRANCLHWQQNGSANTPLALICEVDFEIINCHYLADPDTLEKLASLGLAINVDNAIAYADIVGNLIKEIAILLQVNKPSTP